MFATEGLFGEIGSSTFESAYALAIGKLGVTHVVDAIAKRKLASVMLYLCVAETNRDRAAEPDPERLAEASVRYMVSLNSMAPRAIKT